jgi:hypothetical protein
MKSKETFSPFAIFMTVKILKVKNSRDKKSATNSKFLNQTTIQRENNEKYFKIQFDKIISAGFFATKMHFYVFLFL